MFYDFSPLWRVCSRWLRFWGTRRIRRLSQLTGSSCSVRDRPPFPAFQTRPQHQATKSQKRDHQTYIRVMQWRWEWWRFCNASSRYVGGSGVGDRNSSCSPRNFTHGSESGFTVPFRMKWKPVFPKTKEIRQVLAKYSVFHYIWGFVLTCKVFFFPNV